MKQYNNGIWLTRRGDQIIPNFHSRQNQWKKEVIKVKKEDNQPLDKKEIIHQWEIYQSIADFFDKTKRMILMNYFPLFINSTIGNIFEHLYMNSIYSLWINKYYNR